MRSPGISKHILRTQPINLFDQVDAKFSDSGAPGTLDLLEGHFRRQKDYFRLFEVLKLRCRQNLGLPLLPTSTPEPLPDRQQRELDNGLIDACQTVGTLLFRDGDIQHGWSYLQPTGNRKLIESLIAEVNVDDHNVDMLIDIALNQAASPAYGYQLAMQHHGTCSAITAFEVQANQFDRGTQSAMASGLLHHIYDEVMENMRAHIEQNDQTPRPDADLRALLKEHPWLVEQQAYHLDTTHLASVMKIARLTTSSSDHELALQLAEYGKGFPADFQYPSPAPFENTYPDHLIFFGALLGNDVDGAIVHFQQKCADADPTQIGIPVDEILIDFLYRVGRVDEAIAHATSKPIDPAMRTAAAPDITEMANSPDQFKTVLDHLRSEDDLLAYALTVLKSAGFNR